MSLDSPVDLSTALEHSPRYVIARPTLVPAADSPTGWILVIPADAALADDLAAALETALPFLANSVRTRHPNIETALARYREARQ